MIDILWLLGRLTHRPGRLLGAAVGVALTVALLVAIGTFTTASAAVMTERATADIPVDWQILLAARADQNAITAAVRANTPITALESVGYADVTGLSADISGTTQTTGAGKVLGISPQYRQRFPAELRPLLGTLDGVLVAQQTAANLHVTIGDTVTIERVGVPPANVTVAGVVDLPYADSLFQAVGVPAGTAPQAPPDNILLLPADQWHTLFDPQAVARPDSIRTQLHVWLARDLPADPGAAFVAVQQCARNLEARIAGSGVVGDNLAARLDGARADALYARVLFLFLGTPGVVLAIILTLAVAATGATRRRQEQALLRSRGATTAQILRLEGAEAVIIGLGGVALGFALAVAATAAVAASGLGGDPMAINASDTVIWNAGAALVGLGLAIVAVLVPAWLQARQSTVAAAQLVVGRTHASLWQRLYLDGIVLVIAGVMFWRTASTGYQIVLAPEGVPQTSVAYEAFLAPLGLWIGAALLTLRLWNGSLQADARRWQRCSDRWHVGWRALLQPL